MSNFVGSCKRMSMVRRENKYNLEGRKLLIVGASGHFIPAVVCANRLGAHTIAVNYADDAIAKQYASESAEVDTYNFDELLDFAQTKQVDGVFASWNENNLFAAEYVARNMGLPFYGTKEQLDSLVKKDDFKATCRKYKVPTVPEYYTGSKLTEDITERFEYPVIVKPTDSGGTRGMTILYDSIGLEQACAKAIEASLEKKIIIEKYLRDTKLIVIDFAVQNGNAYLATVADRITVRESQDRVPLGFCVMYPSEYIDMVYEQVMDPLKRMIGGLRIRNGIISFEGMISDGKLYIIECQFRFGGTHIDNIVRLETGIDLMQMMIELSLTGKFDTWRLEGNLEPRHLTVRACQNLQLNPGKISYIGGVDEVKKLDNVDWLIPLKQLGDNVVADGSTARNFCKIGLSGATRKELYIQMDRIQKMLDIRDENGENMVIRNVPQKLCR